MFNKSNHFLVLEALDDDVDNDDDEDDADDDDDDDDKDDDDVEAGNSADANKLSGRVTLFSFWVSKCL